jgi:hypothetical protein
MTTINIQIDIFCLEEIILYCISVHPIFSRPQHFFEKADSQLTWGLSEADSTTYAY